MVMVVVTLLVGMMVVVVVVHSINLDEEEEEDDEQCDGSRNDSGVVVIVVVHGFVGRDNAGCNCGCLSSLFKYFEVLGQPALINCIRRPLPTFSINLCLMLVFFILTRQ